MTTNADRLRQLGRLLGDMYEGILGLEAEDLLDQRYTLRREVEQAREVLSEIREALPDEWRAPPPAHRAVERPRVIPLTWAGSCHVCCNAPPETESGLCAGCAEPDERLAW